MGGLYMVSFGAAVLITAAFMSTLLLHSDVAPIAGPWVGANLLAWLTQSLAGLFLSVTLCSMFHILMGLRQFEPDDNMDGAVRRLGRAMLGSLRRIANKFGFVAISVLVGYVGAVAVFPPATWGSEGIAHSVPDELAKVQLGVGLLALVIIVLYECIRVLEDLLGALPSTFRIGGAAFLLCHVVLFVTEMPLFSFDRLHQNVLSYWAPAAGYTPYTREPMLAELGRHGLGPSWWVAILLMLSLSGFRLFWVRLTRPKSNVGARP